MHPVNKLISLGYDLTIIGDSIRYEYLFKNKHSAEEITNLLQEIKLNKRAALAYIKSIIRLTVDINTGYYSGTYLFMVTDYKGELLYTHKI